MSAGTGRGVTVVRYREKVIKMLISFPIFLFIVGTPDFY